MRLRDRWLSAKAMRDLRHYLSQLAVVGGSALLVGHQHLGPNPYTRDCARALGREGPIDGLGALGNEEFIHPRERRRPEEPVPG